MTDRNRFDGHTPGPWQAVLTDRGWELKQEGYGYIMTLTPCNAGVSNAETNAALIAAAPDLLRERDELAERVSNLFRVGEDLVRERDELREVLAELGCCEQSRRHGTHSPGCRALLARIDGEHDAS